MDNLKKALDRFSDTHQNFMGPDSGYSVGYGLDPERRGDPGIIVYAMSDDESTRASLLRTAKETVPSTWEGFPVYFKGMSVPYQFSASR